MGMEMPEEIAQIQKEQGADSVFDERGMPQILELSDAQVDQLVEDMEKSEKAPDLGTYVRLQKEVVVSSEDNDMSDALKKEATQNKGEVFVDGDNIFYFDRDGSIARFPISFDIESIENDPRLSRSNIDKRLVAKDHFGIFLTQLEELGFKFNQPRGQAYKDQALNARKERGAPDYPTAFQREIILNGEATAILKKEILDLFEKKKQHLEQEAHEQKKKEFDF